jgi:SEC-C motif-containing protein
MSCPCGTGREYDDCCGRFHRGEAHAPTAEALMRSRYSAFVRRDEHYLLRTWHASTRPGAIGRWSTWVQLEVVTTANGGLLDAEGLVEYVATHEDGELRELSRFVRDDDKHWSYLGPVTFTRS